MSSMIGNAAMEVGSREWWWVVERYVSFWIAWDLVSGFWDLRSCLIDVRVWVMTWVGFGELWRDLIRSGRVCEKRVERRDWEVDSAIDEDFEDFV